MHVKSGGGGGVEQWEVEKEEVCGKWEKRILRPSTEQPTIIFTPLNEIVIFLSRENGGDQQEV